MATAIDNLGRKIEASNMSLDEIKGLIGTMMKSKVGPARPVSSTKDDAGGKSSGDGPLKELTAIFETYTKDFQKEVDEQKELLGNVVDNLRSILNKKEAKREAKSKEPRKEKPPVSKEDKATAKASESLYKTFAKKGSGYTHDIYVEKAVRELCSCIKGMSVPATPSPTPTESADAGGGAGGGGGDAAAAAGGGKEDKGKGGKREKTRTMNGLPIADDLAIMSYFIREITNELGQMEKAILGFNTLGTIFKGVIKEERKFVQDMRQISYETAGATKESKALMRSFEDIGSTAKETGMDRDEYQKQYIKGLKSGIKDLKTASAITKSQLNVENQLGLEAGSLGEEFRSWNQSGRMTAGQLADMGRGMRDVAKYTGLTGEALKGAVDSSKEFINQLKNAAQLTSAAARNVIEISANAKKLGIESEMAPLLKAMSSSTNLLLEAGGQVQSLLFAAAGSVGRIDDLTKGVILRSKSGIKDMAKGLNNILNQFGVESADAIDQLTDDAKFQLNISLKAAYGIELGQFRSQIESLTEAGKGYSDRLEEINKKRKQNITLEEKAALDEQERAMKTSASLGVLTAIEEAAKGAKDMNQALQTFGMRRKEFDDDLKGMGITATDNAEIARGAIQNALSSVNEGLKKAKKQEVKIDSSEIEKALKDPAAMRELTAKISKGQQQLSTAQKAQLDPMNEMAQSLREINDNIRNFTNSGFSSLFNSLIGKIAIIGAAIAGVVAGIGLLGVGLLTKIDSFSRVFKEANDRGGFGEIIKGVFIKRKKEDEVAGGGDAAADAAKAAAAAASKPAATPPAPPVPPKAPATADVPLATKGQDIFEMMLTELKGIHKDCCNATNTAGGTPPPAPGDKAAAATAATAPAVADAKVKDKKERDAANKAAGETKAAGMTKEDKVAARYERKKQERENKGFKIDKALQKKDIKSQKQGDTIQNAQQGLVDNQKQTAKAQAANPCPAAPDTSCFDINALMSSGKDMAKVAAAVLILSVGIIALGAAIVFLAKKIMDGFGLDTNTIVQTATAVGAVALAGGAIAAAGAGAFMILASDEVQEFTNKAAVSYPKVLMAAAALMLIGPAIVLLGAAIVAVAGMILSKLKLNVSSVLETAAVIAAVAGVAGALSVGAAEFLECLDELKKNKTWNKILKSPMRAAGQIAKAAIALLIVGSAIILLGVALVKTAQVILGAAGLDAGTAAKVGLQVAALVFAAGAIAGAVIGAAYGLKRLGEFAEIARKYKKEIITGAVALLVMAPAITLLAVGVVKMVQMIMGAFNMDAGVAAKVAYDVAGLLLATGLIAGAVIGAGYGLFALGQMVYGLATATGGIGLLAAIGLMALGGLTLLLMVPAMTLLAIGLVTMCQKLMGAFGLDAAIAAKVAEDLAVIMLAAGVIAVAVLASGWALAQLGGLVLTGLFWELVGLAVIGAVALYALTPAITYLAASIIDMSRKVMKDVVSPDEASQTAKAMADIIKAAAEISLAVVGSVAALAILGYAMTSGLFWWAIGAAILGAVALRALTPAVAALSSSIIYMAKNSLKGGIKAEEAKAIAEGFSSIVKAAGEITEGVLDQVGTLMKLGALAIIGWIIIPMMLAGSAFFMALAVPVAKFIIGMMLLSKVMISASGGLKGINKIVEGLQLITKAIVAVGEVMDTLQKVLLPLVHRPWFGLWGSNKLEELAEAIPQFQDSFKAVTEFIRDGIVMPIKQNMKSSKQLMKIVDIAKAMAEVIKAIDPIMTSLMNVVLPMTSHGWFGFFSSPLDKLTKAIPEFSESFKTIVDFVRDGVIKPVQRGFKDIEKVKKVAQTATAIGDAISSIAPMLDKIQKVVLDMTTEPSFLFISYGSSKLEKLKKAMPEFEATFQIIVDFVKNGLIKPITRAFKDIKKVKDVVQIAGAIGEAIGPIVAMVDGLATKIMPLTEKGGWWSRNFGDARSKMEKIEGMMPDFARVFSIMVNFLKNSLIGIVVSAFPDFKAIQGVLPTIKGVGEAIAAVADMMDALVNKIMPMTEKGGWWARNFGDARSQTEKLEEAIPTIKSVFDSIVSFVREGIMNPVQQAFPDLAKMEQNIKKVKAVGEIIESVSDITSTMQDIANSVSPLSMLKSIFGDVESTISPLEAAIPTIQQTFTAITKFVQDGIIAPVSTLNVRGMEAAVKKLQLIAKSVEIMQDLVSTFEGMIGMTNGKPATQASGYLWWAKAATEEVLPVTTQMNTAIPKIQETFGNIMKFVKEGIIEPVKQLEGIDMKKVAKTLEYTAKAVEKVPDMIDSVNDAMKLMSPGEYMNTAYPMDRIIAGIPWFRNWFGRIAEFIKTGIMEPVLNEFKDIGAIKNAAKIMMAMAKMIEKLPDVLDNLDEAMKMMSPGEYMNTAYPMDRIIAGMGWFRKWFARIAEFVNTGIVAPITAEFKDIKQVLNAAKIMMAVSLMLQQVPKALNALDQAMSMMSPGDNFDLSFPMDRIIAGMGWFRKWFTAIAEFVNSAIVGPIDKEFKDVKKVQTVSRTLSAIACMIKQIPPILSNLDQAMAMMSPGDTFNLNFPMDRIIAGRGWFQKWFGMIADFINVGIVTPVSSVFSDIGKLINVAKALKAMATIAKSIPPVLTGLDEAMSLMSPGDNFNFDFPMDRIIKAIPWFSDWFKKVGEFINVGIVGPVILIFGDGKRLIMAAKIMKSMATIARSIPPIINGLAGAMKLMGDSSFIDQDFPMDRIIANKAKFADWFEQIAKFMKEGIVDPILRQLPDPKTIRMAAAILSAMSRIVTSVPIVINKMATGLIPLIDSGVSLREAPMEAIIAHKALFKQWFTEVAAFMRDGIVTPILTELPEPRTIRMAAAILTAMSRIITILPVVIRKLSALFIPMDPNKCMQDSPVGALATNAPLFKEWFTAIAVFMRDGIIWPILNILPTESDIKEVAARLKVTRDTIDLLPPFLYGLADTLGDLTASIFGFSKIRAIAGKVDVFASYFYGIAAAINNGVIMPIMTGFPSTDDLKDIMDRLGATSSALDALVPWLDRTGESLSRLALGRWTNYFAAYNAESFSPYFKRITSAIGDGILRPMMTLPTSDEIVEINKQMNEMGNALDSAGVVLTVAGEKMDKFAKGWFWRMMDGWKADQFGSTFMNMANAINRGILQPMKMLPPSNEIQEVVNQLDGMVQALDKVADVLDAMNAAMLAISEADIDFSGLDSIPIEKMAMFSTALKDMNAGGNIEMKATGANTGGGSPSDQAIDTRIMKEQADAQQGSTTFLGELVRRAMRGEGLIVQDQMGTKALESISVAQKDELKATTMPTAAQSAAQNDGAGGKTATESFGNKLTDLFKPAMSSAGIKPAIGGLDMRSAAQTMNKTPEQLALEEEKRERNQKNRYTDRRAEREAARRQRREEKGFNKAIEVPSPEKAGITTPSGDVVTATNQIAKRGESNGTGMLTEQAIAEAAHHEAREAEGKQPIGYKLANAASAQQIANQGMLNANIPDVSVKAPWDGVSDYSQSAKFMPENLNTGADAAPVRATAQTSPIQPNMHTAVASDRAGSNPDKTEVTAPELGLIVEETSDQNTKLDTLIDLFTKVLDRLTPKSQPIASGGGAPGSTAPNQVVHEPANYFRSPTAPIAKLAGKAVLNVGVPLA